MKQILFNKQKNYIKKQTLTHCLNYSAPSVALLTLREDLYIFSVALAPQILQGARQDQATVRRSPLILAGARQGQAILRRSPVIRAGTRQDHTRPSRRRAHLLLDLILDLIKIYLSARIRSRSR